MYQHRFLGLHRFEVGRGEKNVIEASQPRQVRFRSIQWSLLLVHSSSEHGHFFEAPRELPHEQIPEVGLKNMRSGATLLCTPP